MSVNEENIVPSPESHDSTDFTGKYRNFCFTLNNYTEGEIKRFKEACEINKYVYICWGHEIGKSGTPHLQGYVEFKSQRYISGIKREDKCFARAKLLPRAPKSNKIKAVTYCFKEIGRIIFQNHEIEGLDKDSEDYDKNVRNIENASESTILEWMRTLYGIEVWRKVISSPIELPGAPQYFESGDWKHGLKPGTRSDINAIRDIVNKGGTMRDVIDHANSYQAMKVGEVMIKYKGASRDWKTEVVWIYGSAGTGKTAKAKELAIKLYGGFWMCNKDLNWFDTYCGEEVVIVDDMRSKTTDYNWLLRLTDRYPLMVPVKQGFVDFKPRIIFITSPKAPQDVFMGDEEDPESQQLLRRISRVIHLTEQFSMEEDVVDPKIAALRDEIDSLPLDVSGCTVRKGLVLNIKRPKVHPETS